MQTDLPLATAQLFATTISENGFAKLSDFDASFEFDDLVGIAEWALETRRLLDSILQHARCKPFVFGKRKQSQRVDAPGQARDEHPRTRESCCQSAGDRDG